MNKQELITLLKKGDTKALEKLYLENRDSFINFSKNFKISQEDVVDAYQDAFIVLREKALSGDLDNLKCSVKTYLFSVGKYVIYAKARKNNKNVIIANLEKEDYDYGSVASNFLSDEADEIQIKLQNGLKRLGKTCKNVLRLFYYRGFTIEEIAAELNYSNKNVVKSKKSRCIKQLKELIK